MHPRQFEEYPKAVMPSPLAMDGHSLSPTTVVGLRIDVRAVALACFIAVLIGWMLATEREGLILSDDVLRVAFSQGTSDGLILFTPGSVWLPFPSMYSGLFMWFVEAPLLAASLSSSLALAGAALLLARTASRMAPRFGPWVVAAAMLASPAVGHLARSGMSEPCTILLAAALGELAASGALSKERRGAPLFYLLLICLQMCRLEAWPATLLLAGVALWLSRRGIGPTPRAALVGGIAALAFPAIWLLPDLVRTGQFAPLVAQMEKIHLAASAGTTLSARLARLAGEPSAIHVIIMALGVAGALVAFRHFKDRTFILPLVLPAAFLSVVVFTVFRGSLSYFPLDRFVAVPALLFAPFAAFALERLAAHRHALVPAAAVLGLATLGLARYDRDVEFYPRRLLRLELVAFLEQPQGGPSGSGPARVLHIYPQGAAEMLPITYAALSRDRLITSQPTPAKWATWQRQRRLAEELGYDTIVIHESFAECVREACADATDGWTPISRIEDHAVLRRAQ